MSKSFLAKDSVTAEADWFDAGTFISGYTSGFLSGYTETDPVWTAFKQSGTENQTTRRNGTEMEWTDYQKIYSTGQWQGNEYYKKAATGSQLYQYNNIVVDEEGNFEKQLKNIAIKTGGTEITLDTPVPIPEMAVMAMRSNEYHLDFRLILEKLAGGESEDVIYNNGMQFIFSNSTANDVSFYNGLSWRADHYYNATLEAQASFHKHADFSNNQTTDALINSVSTNVQRVVLHGEGVFRQHSGSDLLNLKLATVQSGVSGYSVAKGSYMKITLKNEGA